MAQQFKASKPKKSLICHSPGDLQQGKKKEANMLLCDHSAHCHEQMSLSSKPFLLEVLFPLYLRYNKQVFRIYWI